MIRKIQASDKTELIFKHDIFNVEVQNSTEETTIFFYGDVDFIKPNYKEIKAKLTNALSKNQNITIRIHSYGGSVIEGIAFYDLIKSYNNNVTVIVEGIVSDFTLPIALAGDKILMAENAFFNIETIKVFVQGSKDVFISMVKKLEQAQNSLFKIFKTKVSSSYHDDIEKYINTANGVWLESTTCREINLCDEIILPIKKRLFQEDETVSAMILNPMNNLSIDVKASDYLEHKNNWTFKQWQKDDPKGLEKLAIRFPDTFNKLFNAQYPKQAIESNKNSYKPINNNQMSNQKNESRTFKDWQKEDPKGLGELEKNNPEKFKNLFNKQFNSENEELPELLNLQKNWSLSDWIENDVEGLQKLKNSHPNFVNNLSL
jgi:ATP-dependent protease ClpP protease subunit